jgi:hypothetical protein
MKQRRVQDFLFPRNYFRKRVTTLPAVPSYFYHQLDPNDFGRICKEVETLGFESVTVTDILEHRVTGTNVVAITMDDGWSSVWSVAYPLARLHGLRFTIFLTPGFIQDSNECRTTLDDGVDPQVLIDRDHGPDCFLTWGEVRAMHRSGVVDVQSHSLHHGMIFTADRPTDIVTTEGPFPLPGSIPLVIRADGTDIVERRPSPGTPLYSMGPALVAPQRFLEDNGVRSKCIEAARIGFRSTENRIEDWKAELMAIAGRATGGRWESEAERMERFRADLAQAKAIIEERVPGADVRALAPPWGLMHPDIGPIAKQTGHDLIVMAYPFPDQAHDSPLPLYPRLFGDAIWTLLRGSLGGIPTWLASRRRNMARRVSGSMP